MASLDTLRPCQAPESKQIVSEVGIHININGHCQTLDLLISALENVVPYFEASVARRPRVNVI